MHTPRAQQPPVGRRAAALVAVACLLLSCSGQEGGDAASPPQRTTGAPPAPDGQAAARTRSPAAAQPAPEDVPQPLPRVPATHDPAALAGQLGRVTATLRDRGAAAADVRRAGRFQQLAVHALANGPAAFRREVLARLRPRAAVLTRGSVRAARQLAAITTPEQTLPDWHIVVPPPPGELRGYYTRAQRRTGVHWTYLAAIHLVETRMGRIRGTSTAGARGPMQFIPSTWALYGAGGDITDHRDAILAAARLLDDNGAPGDMAEALYSYNPSDSYVRAVTAHARTMQRTTAAYRGYWHWRVFYRHTRGTYVLPTGYPQKRPVLLPGG